MSPDSGSSSVLGLDWVHGDLPAGSQTNERKESDGTDGGSDEDEVRLSVDSSSSSSASTGSETDAVDDRDERPVLVVLHGLTGGSKETYVRGLMLTCHRAGMRVVCQNFRGCNKTELRTPYAYSAGQTHDLRDVVRHVARSCPNAACILVAGFSLGANVITKFLGEEGGTRGCSSVHPSQIHGDMRQNVLEADVATRLAGGIAISNMLDLEKGADHMMSTRVGRAYSKKLAGNMRKYVATHEPTWRELTNALRSDKVPPSGEESSNSDSRVSDAEDRNALSPETRKVVRAVHSDGYVLG
jgi:predicted alpha/beta-fold hydrolase